MQQILVYTGHFYHAKIYYTNLSRFNFVPRSAIYFLTRKNPGDPGVEADLAWLHHELARTYLQEKQMEKALEHSDACVQFAEACQEDAWIIQVPW